VLSPGGRAIFQEPVRNSRLIRTIRSWIPYQAPDVSPFEAPLVDAEIAEFSTGFTVGRSRVFSLPHVNLAQVLPWSRDHLHKVHVVDAAVLRWLPGLQGFAGQRVWELIRD
jgi:hypothetical protein